MSRIWDWLTDRNWKTWAGHGAWGAASGVSALMTRSLLLGVDVLAVEVSIPFFPDPTVAGLIAFIWWLGITTGAFSFREMSDAFAHGVEDAQGQGFKAQLKATWASFTEDGYFDLVSPYVGFGIPTAFVWTLPGLVIFVGSSGAGILGFKVFKKRWPWEGMD